jgi:FkbM family methyltransferase
MRQCIEAFRRQLRRWLKLDIVSAENMITFRHNLTEVLRHYRIDTVLDVGANEGQFAAMLRQGANFRGTIHSFEPASQSFAKLMTRAASDSSWHVHRLALGRSAGEVTLNLSEYSTFSSLLRPSIFGTGTFSDIRVVNTEKVPMSTLDIFVKEHFAEGNARILLKMDTQGFDLEVFDGASESIPRICALISELSLMPIYEGMPRYDEMLETYEKSGFAVSGIFPVTRTSDLALIEVDCLMIRRDALPHEGQLAGMASLPSNRGILLHQVDDSVTPRAGATSCPD